MGTKVVIGAGLVLGILVGGLAVGAAVALLPPPPAPVQPTPTPLNLATPSPSPTPSPLILATPSPSPTIAAVSLPSASTGAGSPSASASASASAAATANRAFDIGQPAPKLKIAKLGGGTLDLAAFRGKPVWINFMATTCASCRDELPIMQGFAARYAKTGLTILVVDVKEPAADVQAYMKGLGVTLQVGLDADGSAANAWKALELPVHLFVDAKGVITAGALGTVGPDQLAKDLQAILPGVKVTP
jgi:thiol-disulfide isomerase/thioredoxin